MLTTTRFSQINTATLLDSEIPSVREINRTDYRIIQEVVSLLWFPIRGVRNYNLLRFLATFYGLRFTAFWVVSRKEMNILPSWSSRLRGLAQLL